MVDSKKVLKEKHLEIYLSKNNNKMRAIWFNFSKEVDISKEIDIVFTIQRDSFKGNDNINLNILDLDCPWHWMY